MDTCPPSPTPISPVPKHAPRPASRAAFLVSDLEDAVCQIEQMAEGHDPVQFYSEIIKCLRAKVAAAGSEPS